MNFDVHFRAVELETVAAELLGAVHCGIGVGEQRVDVVGVVGIVGDPDAARHVQRVARDFKRRGDRHLDVANDRRHRFEALFLTEEQRDELVAADPDHGVGRAHAFDHLAGDVLEQFVARVVAEAVVDHLEIVEIDEGHRGPAVVALREEQRLGQAILE